MEAKSDIDTARRKAVLDTLAAAPMRQLAELWGSWADKPAHSRIRGPETGLVMVRGRAGGGGAPFNLGEASMSRATVRLSTGEIGHGYALGRDTAKVETIAILDALWQRDPLRVETEIVAPLRSALDQADRKRADQSAATKVDFFTMVRGDN